MEATSGQSWMTRWSRWHIIRYLSHVKVSVAVYIHTFDMRLVRVVWVVVNDEFVVISLVVIELSFKSTT